MKTDLRLKSWAGPLTAGSFVVMAVTGILMFFHLNFGAVRVAHEWLGWLLVIGAAAHLMVNWRPFLAYFRKPIGVGIMAAMFLLGALSLFPAGGGPGHHPPFLQVARALESSPLSLVAQVAKCSPQSALNELRTQGVQVQDETQTISEIASANRKQSLEILAYVMGNGNGSMGGHVAR